jgi:D-3-phosphoglycerate dehydrogenase
MEIVYLGGLASKQNKLLTVTSAIGYLKNVIGDANMINALPVCKSKGIEITESASNEDVDYANVIEIRFTAGGKTRSIRGTVIGGQPRLVGIDAFTFDIPFKGDLIYIGYKDAPGVVGAVGNILGEAGVNIGQMSVGRNCNMALMVLNVDHSVSEDIVSKISAAVGTDDLKYVEITE